MKLNKKNKWFLSLLSIVGVSFASSMVFTSCSSVLKDSLKNSVLSKGSDFLYKLENNNDPESVPESSKLNGPNGLISRALKSSSTENEVMTYVASEIALKIIKDNLFVNDKDEPTEHKRAYDKLVEDLKKEYNDLKKEYKVQYKDAWSLKIQQEVLDPSGGTWETYFDNKIHSWATSYLSSLIFKKMYIGLYNESGFIENPTVEHIYNIFSDDPNNPNAKTTFKFSEESVNSNDNKREEDKLLSSIQQIIYDKWIEIENPYVINMSLWKYSKPKNGLSSVYTHAKDSNVSTDSDGNESTTENYGSYIYPYFSKESTNTNPSTEGKFINFLNESKSNANYLIDDPTQTTRKANTYGLKKIPLEMTEDSSTFILAKNSSIFKDLYLEFALSSMYLYNKLIDNSTQDDLVIKINDFSSTGQTLNSMTNIDKILSLFVSDETDAFLNFGGNKTILKPELVKEIININGDFGALIDAVIQPQTKDIWIIDAFIPKKATSPSNEYNLDKFMFLRNQAGVHAISIDGDDYIKGASKVDPLTAKKRAGDVIVYHHFMNKMQYNSDVKFDVELQKNMTDFFNQNLNYILFSYATEHFNDDFFNPQKEPNNENNSKKVDVNNKYYKWIKSIFDLYYLKKNYASINEINKLIYEKKTPFSSNYGDNVITNAAYENGFASEWVFKKYEKQTFDGWAKGNNDNEKLENFKKEANHLVFDFLKVATNNVINYSDVKSKKDELRNNVDAIFYPKSANRNIEFMPLDQKNVDKGFAEYSQYIYTNNNFINRLLLSYLGTSTESDLLKLEVYKNILKENEGKFNKEFNIENAINNYVYGLSLTSQSNQYIGWDYAMKEREIQKNGSNVDDVANQIKYFREWHWKNKVIENESALSSTIQIFEIYLSLLYLIDNNFTNLYNYLTNIIKPGINSFIVWSNSYNYKYSTLTFNITDPNQNPIKISNILDAKNVVKNINNNFESNYISFSSIQPTSQSPIKTNILDNTIFSDNEKYFNFVGGMNGFYGLQQSSSNELNQVVSNELFTNPLDNSPSGKGLLYSYGNDRKKLIDIVKQMTSISEIDNFARELSKITKKFNVSDIVDPRIELWEKKEKFINNINDKNQLPDTFFEKRDYWVGKYSSQSTSSTPSTNIEDNYSLIADPTNQNIKHGAFAIQLKQSDAENIKTLYQTIEDGLNNSNIKFDDSQTNPSSQHTLKNNSIDVILNILVNIAMKDSIQNKAISKFVTKEKKIYEVYDVRLYEQLGKDWLQTWKLK